MYLTTQKKSIKIVLNQFIINTFEHVEKLNGIKFYYVLLYIDIEVLSCII